jgi:alkanesulfonate monooxygenase
VVGSTGDGTDGRADLGAESGVLGQAAQLVGRKPGTRQVDGDVERDSARGRGEHHDARGEEHRLVDAVGHEDRGGPGPVADAADVLLQAFPGERVQRQQAATFQELTGGRLRLNVVTGGDPVEQRAYGDFLDHDERYARTGEFLEVLRRSFEGQPFDFAGNHVQVEGAGLVAPGALPPIYLGGASGPAEDVSARLVDTYLAWGEPPSLVGARVDRVREKAAVAGREIRFGIRLHVISRDTPEEAWAEADRMLAGMSAASIAATQERFARMDSVGQARMAALHGGSASQGARSLEVAPNLWAGIGLVREGAATALVGSHEQIAERIEEYGQLGFDEFILSGYPHLEEAWRVGEEVLPVVGGRAVAA